MDMVEKSMLIITKMNCMDMVEKIDAYHNQDELYGYGGKIDA